MLKHFSLHHFLFKTSGARICPPIQSASNRRKISNEIVQKRRLNKIFVLSISLRYLMTAHWAVALEEPDKIFNKADQKIKTESMKTIEISQKDCDSKRPIYEEIQIDPLFRKISKHSVGFQVFKINGDRVEAIPKDQVGVFFDENAYIIYAAAVKGTFPNVNTITREIKTATTIERFIHLWLGASASDAQSKRAAIKIIELDIHLDHTATQYRETQAYESKRFLSYFKEHGFEILSGSKKTSSSEFPKMYQISGKVCPRCIEKSVSWAHFGSGKVMILQTRRIVFVWVGLLSSAIEGVHALNKASKFRDRLSEHPEIVVVNDGYEQSMSAERKIEWNKFLNLSDRLVVQQVVGKSTRNCLLKLYKCTNVNGLFKVEHMKTDAIEQIDFMDKSATFIIDGDSMGIWIWIGRNVGKADKADGMRHALGYVIKRSQPSYYPVCRVIDGHESTEFTSLFPSWSDNDSIGTVTSLEKFDAITLIQRPQLAAQMQLIDDGSGDIKVYRIENDDIIDVPKRFGQVFYSENCYIVHYQTQASANGHSIKNLIYLWTGRQCKQINKTTGELYLAEMFEHFSPSVAQIRIYENMEPPSFLQLFKGKFIILNGPDSNHIGRPFSAAFILKVIGNSSYTAKAIEVTNKTSHSSHDCYIIRAISGGPVWVWCGQSSTGDNREMAKSIAGIIGEPNIIMENAENEEFYRSVGDKCISQLKQIQYTSECSLGNAWEKPKVNLYLASLSQGQILLDEIFAFDQSDLTPDNIFLLDVGSTIYVWIGNLVDTEKRQAVWVIALHLISIHPIPRNITLPIAVIRQGFEPITFIGFFNHWNPKLIETYKTFDKLRVEMNLPVHPVPLPRASYNEKTVTNEFDKHHKYPLEMLRGDPSNLPTYINPSKKEIHLTHDDFVSVFKMEFSEFEALPKWKKTQLKKEHLLF